MRSLSEELDTVSQAGDLARYQVEKKMSILSGISVDLEDDAFIGQEDALTLNETSGGRQKMIYVVNIRSESLYCLSICY